MQKRALVSLLICITVTGSSLAASNQSSAINSAINLFNQHQYASAANAFEVIIKTATPNARLYYYAALSNMQSGKVTRAKQLFEYIVKYFPNTQEAIYAQKVAPTSQSTAQDNFELPESVKQTLPKEMQAMLNTPEGRQAVKEVIQEQPQNYQLIKNAETQSQTGSQLSSAVNNAQQNRSASMRPFSAQDIARDGAAGIDQSRYPNCWFEASMSALAQIPRGQKLLANTIRWGKNGNYIVRFANDGVEYNVSKDEIQSSSIHDKALWASIIECAELQKFPNNSGAGGIDNDQSRLEIGLGCITGHKAEVIYPKDCTIHELSTFIGSAVSSHDPIVAGTWNAERLSGLPQLIVPTHAYAIIDFNPAQEMVVLRNPHGIHSKQYALNTDPQHFDFQQLPDGVVKMNLATFQKYFYSVARSFI